MEDQILDEDLSKENKELEQVTKGVFIIFHQTKFNYFSEIKFSQKETQSSPHRVGKERSRSEREEDHISQTQTFTR
jgi:hypothetical protein